ncbi:MAG TPA: beta-ketoacyl synthase N-terminal-like domain-containing protein [Casimicrobiaceae bacterium]|nr:beta-ketoacyl synthase N-terminal-like domain-containing protein [Casimicrobiaceae bacterium]
MKAARIVITGTGAVCGLARDPAAMFAAIAGGRSAIGPIRGWDTNGWPVTNAAEIADFNARALVDDRKLHKLIRRTDMVGIYAGDRAAESAGYAAYRDALDEDAANAFCDRTGVYVGSGGGNYDSQYDYFPLLTEAREELRAFGSELANTVNPMWLLRTLPNNVLGHIGIRHGFKGSNACITNHSIGGTLAVIEAGEALRNGEADRALAVGHDAPIEPQMVLYYHDVGLLAKETIRPFDARRDGSLFGEGAAALALETEASARERGATVLGEILGGGSASDGLGLLAIREDGDALARAIELALEDACMQPSEIGMIAAHGNGTPQSDASEAAAIRRVLGTSAPPATAFKWAFGHLIAAAGILDAVLALHALRAGFVPGVATYALADPDCGGARVSREPQTPRSDVALVLCRGFAGTNAALLLRAAR